MGVGVQRHAPATLPPGKTRPPLYKTLGEPHGRSGRVRKNSSPTEFDARAFQPVASRYTDWTIPAICAEQDSEMKEEEEEEEEEVGTGV
jgi:hypothetical protein